jgi:hypothetical protein
MGVTSADQEMGLIWSKHCITPYVDAILIGDYLFFIRSDGSVTSEINIHLLKDFGDDA